MSAISTDNSIIESHAQASIYSDLNSLDKIRQQGLVDESGAIKQAAKEFESFFLNLMLKSMRQASEVIGADSMMGSQQEKMYTGMLDEQLSVDLSHRGSLGISEMLIEQLSRNGGVAKLTDELAVHLDKIKKDGASTAVSESTSGSSVKESQQAETPELSLFANIKQSLEKQVSEKHISENVQLTELTTDKVSSVQTEEVALQKPEKKALFNQITDFIEKMLPHAEKAAKKLNIDPRILVAQAALETGWGKFIMHDGKGKPGFNLFGIKADAGWQGESIKIDTLEVENQQFKKVNASFRKYLDFSDSFEDYVNFVKNNPRYEDAVNSTSNPESYVKKLQSSGYATDPNYAKKIMRIFSSEVLQNFNSLKNKTEDLF